MPVDRLSLADLIRKGFCGVRVERGGKCYEG